MIKRFYITVLTGVLFICFSFKLFGKLHKYNCIDRTKIVSQVDVAQFGAKGDGLTDDAPAIRKAVVFAKSNNIPIVKFGDNKVYLLASTVKSIFIPIFSGITYLGGENTVLLQGPNQLINQDAKVFFSESPIVDVAFKNLIINLNGVNNLGSFIIRRMNIAIGAKSVKNITIDNVRFENNAGRQTIMLGANINPKTATNVTVTNCTFTNVGNAVTGNSIQTDHSCIYVISNGFVAKNNVFINRDLGPLRPVATAIESHSDNSDVEYNTVKNFKNMFVISAMVSSQIESSYKNNRGENVMRLAEFWTRNNQRMAKISLSGNQVTQKLPVEAINLYTQVLSPIGSISVLNNTISYTGKRSSKYSLPCIYSRRVKNLTIKTNEFNGIASGVFQNVSVLGGQDNIDFSYNKIINCGNTNSRQKIQNNSAILLNGVEGNSLTLIGNKVENGQSNYILNGGAIDNKWKRKTISKNTFKNVSSPAFRSRF